MCFMINLGAKSRRKLTVQNHSQCTSALQSSVVKKTVVDICVGEVNFRVERHAVKLARFWQTLSLMLFDVFW